MCAPCKVIINQMHQDAGRTADFVRDLIIGQENGSLHRSDGTAADSALLELAAAEVDAIKKIQTCAKKALLRHLEASKARGDDPRSEASGAKWAALVERLFS